MLSNLMPSFTKWVDSKSTLVSEEDAIQCGRMFIASNIPATSISSRGEVYDAFEKIISYAEIHKELYSSRMNEIEKMNIQNMLNLAKGVKWAVEHDGFDHVKYDPISKWGYDIQAAQGVM